MLIIFDNSMQVIGTGGQFEAQVCNSKKVMTWKKWSKNQCSQEQCTLQLEFVKYVNKERYG